MPQRPDHQPVSPVGDLLGRAGETIRFAERVLAPVLDLMIRLWLAQSFFVSAIIKVGNWDNALYLAAHEYPVSWLDPVTAAWLGAGIELIGSVLLALGLGARFGALAMLVLTIVAHVEYAALDQHLFWVALLAWTAVHGAGPLSLDHAMKRGLADSALGKPDG